MERRTANGCADVRLVERQVGIAPRRAVQESRIAAAMAQATHVAVVVLLPATMRTSGNGHMLLECGPLCEVPAEGAVSLHTRTDLAGGSWRGWAGRI